MCVRNGHQSSIALLSCKFVWTLKQLGWIHTNQFALCTIAVDFGGRLLIMHPNSGTSCLHFQKHCPRRWEFNVGLGGMFCLLEFGNIDLLHALMFLNPLTNKIKELPKLESSWSNPLVWHMLEDVKQQSYKMILSSNQNFEVEDDQYLITKVYDSIFDTWRIGGSLLSSLRFPFSNGAMCNGVLYYLVSKPTAMYDILIEYNLDTNEWNEVPHIILINTFCTPYLFEMGRTLANDDASSLWSCLICKLCNLFLGLVHHALGDENRNAPKHVHEFCIHWRLYDKQLRVMGNAPNKDLIIAIYEINQSTWLWFPPCLLSSSKHIESHNTFTYFLNLIATPTTSKITTTSTHNWYKTIVWPMFLEKGKWSTIFFLQFHSKFVKLTIDFSKPIEKSC